MIGSNLTKIFHAVHEKAAQNCVEMVIEMLLEAGIYLDEDVIEEKSQGIMKKRLEVAGFSLDEALSLSQYPYESVDGELQYKFIAYELQFYMHMTGFDNEYTLDNIIKTLNDSVCQCDDDSITEEDFEKLKTYDKLVDFWG